MPNGPSRTRIIVALVGALTVLAIVLIGAGIVVNKMIPSETRRQIQVETNTLPTIPITMHDESALASEYTIGQGFALRLPAGFRFENRFEDGRGCTMYRFSQNSDFKFDVARNAETFRNKDDSYVKWARSHVEGPIESEGPTTINGISAHVFTCSDTNGGTHRYRSVFLIAPDGNFYSIRTVSPAAAFDTIGKIIDSAFSTFVTGDAAADIATRPGSKRVPH